MSSEPIDWTMIASISSSLARCQTQDDMSTLGDRIAKDFSTSQHKTTDATRTLVRQLFSTRKEEIK